MVIRHTVCDLISRCYGVQPLRSCSIDARFYVSPVGMDGTGIRVVGGVLGRETSCTCIVGRSTTLYEHSTGVSAF